MKNLVTAICIISSLFLLSSCNKTKTFTEDFKDSWSLTNMSGGLIGIDCNFEKDEIKWTISESTIDIENNAEQSGNCATLYFKSGTYDIIEDSGNFYLDFDEFNWGLIEIEGDIMTINGTFIPDGEVSDAISYSFVRN